MLFKDAKSKPTLHIILPMTHTWMSNFFNVPQSSPANFSRLLNLSQLIFTVQDRSNAVCTLSSQLQLRGCKSEWGAEGEKYD